MGTTIIINSKVIIKDENKIIGHKLIKAGK